ncbi:MAG: phosphohydrolase, partial [Sulfurospirillum sp.]
MEKLAYKSLHLTPKLLEQELEIIGRDLEIFITHIKPSMQNIIEKELKLLNLLKGKSRVLKAGEFLKNRTNHPNSKTNFMDISKALSKEKDLSKILEMILIEAISYTNCEGGTIYLKENNELHFKTIINKKLDIHINNLKYPTIPLFINGKENKENVSATSVIQKKSINIPDVYICNYNGLSFEGVKKFDKANKYRTKSMLVIPMINQDDEVIGVLQLINKKLNDSYIQFDQDDINMTTTYTNWAASAITKDRLVDDLEALLLSFLESISIAISEKSTYGYEHIQRVAQLMKIVSGKINEDKTLFKDINYTKEQLKELEIAAWMHDIGKIATPEYIIDKATKLETISDRIEHIKTRFDYIKSALKAQMLEQKIELLEKNSSAKEIAELENSYQKEIELLNSDIDFLQRANQPKFGILSEE